MGKFAKGVNSEIIFSLEKDEGILGVEKHANKIPFNSSSLGSTTNMTDAETITGRRDAAKPIMGNHDVNGSITIPLDTNILGLFFTAGFGQPNSTELVTGASIAGGSIAVEGIGSLSAVTVSDKTTTTHGWKHVFKVTSDMPSFTVQQSLKDVDQYDVFSGCKINTISFEIGGDGELTADIDIMGMEHSSGTDKLSGLVFDRPISMKRVVALDALEVELGGIKLGTATNFSVNMDFGLDGDSYFLTKDGYRGTISEGIFTCTGTLTCMLPKNANPAGTKDSNGELQGVGHSSSTIFSTIADGKETSLYIKCTTNENRSISFKFPEVLFEEVTPGIEGPKGISVELNYHAYLDNSSENSSVVIELINEVCPKGYELPKLSSGS